MIKEEYKELIDQAKEKSLAGEKIEREVLLKLLEFDPDSEEALYLGQTAREIARKVAGNQGKIWASIGVDYQPCPMNCDFCSFGEKWGLMTEGHVWTDEEVIKAVQEFVIAGATWITLRTTQFYGIERLNALAKKVRAEVVGEYSLVANTGEFNNLKAKNMLDAGIDVVYHTLRLREGKNTKFQPGERLETLAVIRDSELKLAYLVEPVGAEHSNEEIVDTFLVGMEHGATLTGAMARVNLPGTPFAGAEALSEARLAQIIAVTRIAGGRKAPEICVHPPMIKALEWGANLVVVETGAVPRQEGECSGSWQGFDIEKAKSWFQKTGYDLDQG